MAWVCGNQGCPSHSQPSHRCQGWKLAPITGSVGRGGQNRAADVKIVQGALNQFFGKPGGPAQYLATDGSAGRSTITAITAYQTVVVRAARPDGRVDPGGSTFGALSGQRMAGASAADAIPSSPGSRCSTVVKVYIWPFRGKRDAWGHASMQVGCDYISWWPMAVGRDRSKVHPDVYAAHPTPPRSLAADTSPAGGEGTPPTHTILIRGLDETRIRNWWHRTFPWAAGREGPPSIPWSSLEWNCSKVVATALKEGGGDRFASWSKSWNLVWTPNDVREYAESIVKGMAERP